MEQSILTHGIRKTFELDLKIRVGSKIGGSRGKAFQMVVKLQTKTRNN